MCYYFKLSIVIKHIDIARHRYRLQIRDYEGFIAQWPQIGGHRISTFAYIVEFPKIL